MPSHYKEIGKIILLSVAIAGVITLAAISPHGTAVLWKLVSKKLNPHAKEREQRKKFSQALYKLKKSRLLIMKESPNGTFNVELTEKGKRKAMQLRFDDLTIAKPKNWDGIWRIVIFDIPNKKTNARDALRFKLRDLGFYQLQKSVWVFPYPCDSFFGAWGQRSL